ncbi:unnamed protein product [Orchesella dallaii]|uniref:TLC domain-containing protein n=1 Tax=Orchesella dallaii TaxID=48710 RepID=A0ABP1QJB0_9HEXA
MQTAYVSILDNSHDFVSKYFHFAAQIGSLFVLLAFLKVVWFRRDDLVGIFAITEIQIKNANIVFHFGRFVGVSALFANTVWMYFAFFQVIGEENLKTTTKSGVNPLANLTDNVA